MATKAAKRNNTDSTACLHIPNECRLCQIQTIGATKASF
jgi:hypothetical protein